MSRKKNVERNSTNILDTGEWNHVNGTGRRCFKEMLELHGWWKRWNTFLCSVQDSGLNLTTFRPFENIMKMNSSLEAGSRTASQANWNIYQTKGTNNEKRIKSPANEEEEKYEEKYTQFLFIACMRQNMLCSTAQPVHEGAIHTHNVCIGIFKMSRHQRMGQQ